MRTNNNYVIRSIFSYYDFTTSVSVHMRSGVLHPLQTIPPSPPQLTPPPPPGRDAPGVEANYSHSVADPNWQYKENNSISGSGYVCVCVGGVLGMRRPLGVQILSLSCSFRQKSLQNNRLTHQWRNPGYLRGGGANPPGAPIYHFAKISQKMYEIERIWTRGLEEVLMPPPLRSNNAHHFYSSCSSTEK